IIPEDVELKGTLRTFDAATRSRLHERIVAVAEASCALARCSLEHEWITGTPAVVNDAESVERFRKVAARVVGPDNVTVQAPIMGGDDMALWLAQARGCYFFVGTSSDADTSWAHHHP